MNDKKIQIIFHLANENFYNRLIQSLETVTVPENFSVEVQPVEGEEKYFAYETAMRASDAKYKIYIDEQAVVTNTNFLAEMLKIFQSDNSIGAIGTSGVTELSTHGVSLTSAKRAPENFCGEVEIVDGFFFATQYDIPWRQDLFTDNFFGGQAQCLEFKRKGYKIFIGGSWISYVGENFNLDEQSRQKFLDEYSAELFPLVTILIPTFNRPKYFREALESALNQTYRNIEIVISDDSTNDETEHLMRNYNDSRIKYFRNKGFTSHDNWNFLRDYNNPAAEYVNWLMDDDLFYPTKIERMVEVYRKNPDVSLVTSAKNVIDANSKILGNTQNFFGQNVKISGDEAGRMEFFLDNYIGEPTTVLIRKKFLRNNDLCWNEDERGFFSIVDVSTWLQLLTKGNFVRLIDCLSACRCHEGQATNWKPMKALFVINYAKLLKTAIERKVYVNDKKHLRLAILFIMNKGIDVLREAILKNNQDKKIDTVEKILVVLAQSLTNGYKFELPSVEYTEQDELNLTH